MFARQVTLNHSSLESYYCPLDKSGCAKVAYVALTILLLGAGIAILSQQIVLIPKLRFMVGGYLMGLSLFPALAFAVIHCCKTSKKSALKQKTISPPLSNALSFDTRLFGLPLELVKHITHTGSDPVLDRSRLSRTSKNFYQILHFKPEELKEMGAQLGQLGRGNRTESTLKWRSFRSLFPYRYLI